MKRIITMMLTAIMVMNLTACGDNSKEHVENAGATAGAVSSSETDRHAAENNIAEGDPVESTTGNNTESQADPKQETTDTVSQIDSELFHMIPGKDLLPMENCTWVEKDGYGALVMKGIEPYPRDIIWEAMKAGDYSSGSSWGWGDKQMDAVSYKKYIGQQTTYLQVVYCGVTDTLAIIAGEIPSKYTWQVLVGLPEEERLAPTFDGEVYDYLPKTSRQAIALSYADSTWADELVVYRMGKMNSRRLESFIDFLEDYGYEEVKRETPDDQSMYYEGRIIAYRDLNMYVTIQLAMTEEKLMMAVSAPGFELSMDEMWTGAREYQGDKDGIDPDAVPMDGYPVIDLATAEISEEKGATAYRFENIEYDESVLEYVKGLKAQGYKDCDFWYKGYEADTFSGSVYGATTYNIFESLTNGTEYVFVSYYRGRLLVLKSDKMITWSELDLCSAVDMPYVPGVNYLCGVAREVLSGYSSTYDTAGHAAESLTGATVSTYNETVKRAKDLGFTNLLNESQNENHHEFHAWRQMPEGSRYPTLYVHLFLDGDYLEAQVSFERDAKIMGK